MTSVTRTLRAAVWIAPAVILVGTFVYFPVVENFRLSLTSYSAFTESEFVGFDNYVRAWNDPIVWNALRNNIAYALVSVVIQVGGGLLLAGMLELYVVPRFRSFLRTAYFLPITVSITVAGMLFTFIYNPELGLLAELARLVGRPDWARNWLGSESTAIWGIIAMSQWQTTGYIAVLLTVAMQRVPGELYEAAYLDGASRIRAFFNVTVPLIREMTTLLTIVTVAQAFLVFNEVIVMTEGGPNNSSHVLGSWLYRSAFFNDQPGYASAIAVILFVITLVVSAAQLLYSNRKRVEY
jgi:raffinose/stachyose/melibiose transport system permease protein